MPEHVHFVILHHRLKGGEHWDLMLEHGDVLLTWQLERDPTQTSCLPIGALRIGDHRKAYLTYEGPISGDRGEVRRLDAGTVQILELSPDLSVFRLSGSRVSGHFRLSRDGERWMFDISQGGAPGADDGQRRASPPEP